MKLTERRWDISRFFLYLALYSRLPQLNSCIISLIFKSKFNKVLLKLQTRTKCRTSATRAGPQSTGYVTRPWRVRESNKMPPHWQHTLKITKEDVRRLKATVYFKQIACWLVEQLWKSPSHCMSNSFSFSKSFWLVFHNPISHMLQHEVEYFAQSVPIVLVFNRYHYILVKTPYDSRLLNVSTYKPVCRQACSDNTSDKLISFQHDPNLNYEGHGVIRLVCCGVNSLTDTLSLNLLLTSS